MSTFISLFHASRPISRRTPVLSQRIPYQAACSSPTKQDESQSSKWRIPFIVTYNSASEPLPSMMTPSPIPLGMAALVSK